MRPGVPSNRRVSMTLLAPLLLLGLLGLVARLQYQWVGEVSDAERFRLRASLRARATDLGTEFDRELTQLFVALQTAGQGDEPSAASLGTALVRWRSTSLAPAIASAVYLVDTLDNGNATLARLDEAAAIFQPTDWSAELDEWRARVFKTPFPGAPSLLLADRVDASLPALVVPLPSLRRIVISSGTPDATPPLLHQRSLLVLLDRERLIGDLLEPLVARHFGAGAEAEYFVDVTPRGLAQTPVFSSGGPFDPKTADISSALFDVKQEAPPAGGGVMTGTHQSTGNGRVSITVVRRGAGAGNGAFAIGQPEQQGAWLLTARHRRGSLDAVVDASRRRNLTTSGGVLVLLIVSFALVVVSVRREQRLARQQIAFVAAVSHELRTPLAVIRSAGENLADGVVAETEQVRRYGALVESEGRRLSDMVERVMEYAGMTSGASARRVNGIVDLRGLVDHAVTKVSAEAKSRQITVAVRGLDVADTVGDPAGLESAFLNVIGNAVKYSHAGGHVDVSLTRDAERLKVKVSDRGIGIDADDLPRVFEPFFRARRAVDAQVRGTGIGLAVVRHAIDAHHGRVEIVSRPGDGTTVTIDVPAHPIPLPEPAA